MHSVSIHKMFQMNVPNIQSFTSTTILEFVFWRKDGKDTNSLKRYRKALFIEFIP